MDRKAADKSIAATKTVTNGSILELSTSKQMLQFVKLLTLPRMTPDLSQRRSTVSTITPCKSGALLAFSWAQLSWEKQSLVAGFEMALEWRLAQRIDTRNVRSTYYELFS